MQDFQTISDGSGPDTFFFTATHNQVFSKSDASSLLEISHLGKGRSHDFHPLAVISIDDSLIYSDTASIWHHTDLLLGVCWVNRIFVFSLHLCWVMPRRVQGCRTCLSHCFSLSLCDSNSLQDAETRGGRNICCRTLYSYDCMLKVAVMPEKE